MIKNKKGDFEFSFAWIFAIIAGVFILILSNIWCYKIYEFQKHEINAQTAMEYWNFN